jgi:transposase InsO family protein
MQGCITVLAKEASVQRACALLEVSRSGYYAAQARPRRSREVCPLGQRVKEAFGASEQTYGSRRIQAALRSDGVTVGRYRVRRLMREQGLRPVWKRAFVVTTQRDAKAPVAENHLDRQFDPSGPNGAWVTDITYVRTRAGWSYLAAVLDLFNRKVVGWSVAPRMDAELACSALRMALQSRQPAPGLLVHSDQGCQYTSDAWRRLLEQYGAQASMSRRGNCWDNAVAERFFLNLKTERVGRRDYANSMEVARDITDYIVGFYNERRIHSTLGYLSPNAYERKWTAEPPIEVSEIT